MSLTNPNTPVSQQDLQDFYHKLLPYMGGSFGMIANKFSKGDMYSTDEKMIGQWIDGKPLYQKTYSTSVNITSASTSDFPIVTGFDYIDVVKVEIFRSSDSVRFILPNSGCNVNILSNGNLRLNTTSGTSYSGILIFTIQYTKTTDSAISIGDDTDYSTEEKIVGTWIDGKPIYQKVFPTNATMVSSFTIMISDTTEYNIAGIVKCDGIRYYPVGTTAMECVPMLAYIDVNASAKPVYCYMYGAAAQFNYIILQYTKTTD